MWSGDQWCSSPSLCNILYDNFWVLLPSPLPIPDPSSLPAPLGANGCSWSKLLLQASPGASCHFRRLQKCPMCSQHSQHSWVLRSIITFSWCTHCLKAECRVNFVRRSTGSLEKDLIASENREIPSTLPHMYRKTDGHRNQNGQDSYHPHINSPWGYRSQEPSLGASRSSDMQHASIPNPGPYMELVKSICIAVENSKTVTTPHSHSQVETVHILSSPFFRFGPKAAMR